MFNTKNLRRAAIGSLAGLTLAAGLAAGAGYSTDALYAQSDTPTEQQGQFWEMRGGKGRGGFGERGFGHRGGMNGGALLANALGVTPVQLQEAHESARNATIDQAAAAGVITAEQATQLKDGQRLSGDASGLRTYMADVDKDAALAAALNITPEALAAAKDSQVQKGVEAGLISQEQGNQMLLRQKIQEATKAAVEQAIDEAVAEGLITQEEADGMKDRGSGHGPGHEGRRGHRGPGARGQGRGGNGGIFNGGIFNGGIFNGGIFDGGGFFGAPDAPEPTNAALNDA